MGAKLAQLVDQELLNRCLNKARTLSLAYESVAPPFSLREALEHFGVSEVRERLLDRDARLVLVNGRSVIEINILFPKVRRRLSLGHEIGHIIVNECSGRDRFCISHCNRKEESLCNRLAGELLVPEWAIRRYFDSLTYLQEWQSPIRCSTILDAASRFSVSIDAMACRVFKDLKLAPNTIALVWRYTGNGGRLQKALRIASVWRSTPGAGFIPLNKTAPPMSVILKAFERDGIFQREEELCLGSLKGMFTVETAGFDWATLWAAGRPSRGVLALLTA